MDDYHKLPKLRDSISYLYVEHAVIEQNDSSIAIVRSSGRVPVPIASLTCLMLGPGTSVTHAAIKTITDNGCLIVWCGDHGERFYAKGMGETHSSKNLLRQAELYMNPIKHLEVAKRMYERRFPKFPEGNYDLQQLRGMEGIRVKEAYKLAAKRTGVKWSGRNYKTTSWDEADPINRALSVANTVLYSVCQAAIESLGYSSALGFIHTGKMLSFVYDVADLYKASTTIPAAFEAVQRDPVEYESLVKRLCRNKFDAIQLLKRIPEDLEWIFREKDSEHKDAKDAGDLWDPAGPMAGGVNYGVEEW